MKQSKLIQRTGPEYPFTVQPVLHHDTHEEPGHSAVILLQKAKYKGGVAWLLRWPDRSVRQQSSPSILSLSLFCGSGTAFVDSDGGVYLIDRLTFSPRVGRPMRTERWRFSMDDTRTIARLAIPDRYGMDVGTGPTSINSLRSYTPISNPGGSMEDSWRYTRGRKRHLASGRI